jgi:hypothetical protein
MQEVKVLDKDLQNCVRKWNCILGKSCKCNRQGSCNSTVFLTRTLLCSRQIKVAWIIYIQATYKKGPGANLIIIQREGGDPCRSTWVLTYYTHLLSYYEDDKSPVFLSWWKSVTEIMTIGKQVGKKVHTIAFSDQEWWNDGDRLILRILNL